MSNVESPAADGALASQRTAGGLPPWRDVCNYVLQLVSLAIFFGVGLGLTLAAPLIRLLLGRERFVPVGREIMRQFYVHYQGWLRGAGLFRIRYEGCDELGNLRGAIIAANHPGLLDAIFLLPKISRPVCIMRAGLMHNLCIAGAAWLAGYITNDRGPGLIRQCCRKLSLGDNLLIFPEGTRTRSHARGVNPFKSGFALTAVLTGAPVQTVFIERSGVYLGKETSLAVAARIPIEMTIRAGEIFRAEPGETAKAFSARLESYFRAHLANTDDGVRLRD